MLGFCRFCHSSNTKISFAYPSDYYCLDCKEGGSLDTLLSKKDKEKIDNVSQNQESARIVAENSTIISLVRSDKPCSEVFLDEESQIAVWPILDNGVCDYE